MNSRAWVRACGVVWALVFAVCPLGATQNGTVMGNVFDAQGNPLAGAQVHLINPLTGFSRSKVTDAGGNYEFDEVPATDSTMNEYFLLSVEKAGYQRAEQKFSVSVAQMFWVRPPITMKTTAAPAPAPAPTTVTPTPVKPAPTPTPTPVTPAPTPTPVTPAPAPGPTTQPKPAVKVAGTEAAVTTAAARLDLASNTMGGVIDSRDLRTLPLADRDFLDLALLIPGAYPVEQGSSLQGASLVVNGVRADMNNFLLDGTDNNDYTINQSLPFQIVEGLQEFRVQTGTSPAEYGRNGGAQINSVTRRGLNTFHGSLFEFFRDAKLGANNFFSVYNGGSFDRNTRGYQQFGIPLSFIGQFDPLSDPGLAALYSRKKPGLVQNQFGGNAGGALKKDKLFAFVNWEGFRVSNPRPVFERVPGTGIRSCAGCNPTALALFNLYPVPNVGPVTGNFTDGTPGAVFSDPLNGPALFVGESVNRTFSNNSLERLDWQKSDRASFSIKHNLQSINQIQGGTVPGSGVYPGSGIGVKGSNQNFSLNYVQTVSPRTTNELRLGWNRFSLNTLSLDSALNPFSLGSPNCAVGCGIRNQSAFGKGLPHITMGGSFFNGFYASLGADLGAPSERANDVYSVEDAVNLSHGNHGVKFGGEVRYDRLIVNNQGLGRGLVGLYSPGSAAVGGTFDIASVARADSAFGGGFERDFRTWAIDGFFQDAWRARNNLTFNYGARYEINTAPVEARDRLVNYIPNLIGPGQDGVIRANSTTIYSPLMANASSATPCGVGTATGNLCVLGTASKAAPRGLFSTAMNNFSPRFGFGWSPRSDSNLVVRGAYAVMFDQQPLEPDVNMLLNPPFVQQDFSFNNSMSSLFQAGTPGFFSSNGWFRVPYSITARDPNTRTPYVQQYNLGIQRQLAGKGMVEVDYIGSTGRKLPRLREISRCSLAYVNQQFLTNLSATSELCIDPANPFLFPAVYNQENSTNSSFNSLLVRFVGRAYHGLEFGAYYQWAKSMDNASSLLPQISVLSPVNASAFVGPSAFDFFNFNGFNTPPLNPEDFAAATSISPTLSLRPGLPTINTQPNLPQDSSNLRGERGLSDFNIRQRFVMNFIYDVPKASRLGAAGRGWQLAGIATLEGGQPYSVYENLMGLPLRPQLLSSPIVDNSSPNDAFHNGGPICFAGNIGGSCGNAVGMNFDPTTFFLSPGNLGRNTFTGPPVKNMDFSVLKNSHIGRGEGKTLQIRAEFFNAFDTTNFLQPYSKGGTGVDLLMPPPNGQSFVFFDPFFGKILQSRSAFQAQFGAKLIF